MKKRIIGPCLVLLLAMACQKEPIHVNETEESSGTTHHAKAGSTYEKLYSYYSSETQETDYFCHGSDGNCLPAVTVTPKSIQEVFDQIIDATAASDDVLITSLFSNHVADLTAFCPINLINGVVDGIYTVRSGNDHHGDSIKYLLFYNGSGEVEMALPIEI